MTADAGADARWSPAMFAAAYLVLAIFMALSLASLRWMTYRELALRGAVAEGQVLKTSCAAHSSIRYQFVVGGRTISANGKAGYGNPTCRALSPGMSVQLSYLPDAPGTSASGDARAQLRDESISVVTGAVLIPFMVIFPLFLRARRRAGQRSQQ